MTWRTVDVKVRVRDSSGLNNRTGSWLASAAIDIVVPLTQGAKLSFNLSLSDFAALVNFGGRRNRS